MFVVDPAATDAIHQAFNEDGELAAIVELRRHFPLLTDNEHARTCVHAIAGLATGRDAANNAVGKEDLI